MSTFGLTSVGDLELSRARTAHVNILDDIRKVESRIDESREALEKDWGRDWEWKKLDGTCIEKDLGECVKSIPCPSRMADMFWCRYTYIMCFFGEATQKSNNNHMRTSLG